MANVAKKKNVSNLIVDVDSYKNQHNPFWYSNLFNPVYIQNDVPLFHGEVPNYELVEFSAFLEQFQTFVETLEGENLNSCSERTTINKTIKPVLEILGYRSASNANVEPWLEDESFTMHESDGLKTYKPDFIVVNDHKNLKYIQEEKGQKKLEEARSSVILPIEAKYWGRIDEYYNQYIKEDSARADKKNNSESSKAMDFDEQCLKYMEVLNRPYGILTDGKIWRLYSLSFSSPSHRPYFQFNLGHMIKHIQNSDFLTSNSDRETFEQAIKYFYFIFRKKSLFSEQGEELFVDELLNYSKKYVARVEEDLKNRFVNAMKIACNGFQRATAGQKYDIDLIRSVSESHIFNILFLKYCETKNILPIKQDPEGYRRISISDILDRLENFDPNKEEDNLNELILKRMFRDINYSPSGVELYDRLIKLTKVVQDGTRKEFKNFTIKGFKESIFSVQEWKFVNNFKLTNKEMINILFEIGYSKSDVSGRKYQQIPYNSFSPRQLGSIYESFLEFKLERADGDLAFINGQWVPANLKSDKVTKLDVPKAKKGELFFTPDNNERKITGSYYTPDFVVQFLVKETLGTIIKGKSSKEILDIKVCDPSMGSGHFLSAALDFLAKKYNDSLVSETNDDISLPSAVIKRDILHNCIFGVDINPRAVKLAKMSLWLESAIATESLENLENHILVGDSLEVNHRKEIPSFNWKKNVFEPLKIKGFSALLMNPPYQNHKLVSNETRSVLAKKYPEVFKVKADISNYFLALARDILIEGGNLGIITSRYFIDGTQSKGLRNMLHRSFRLSHVVNFENFQVFDANTLTLCLIADRDSDINKDNQTLVSIFEDELVGKKFEQWPNNGIRKIEISQEKLFKEGASAMRDSNHISTKVKTIPLGKLFFTGRGGSTGLDKAFVMNQKIFKEIELEEKYAVSIIKNGDIRSYHYYKSNLKKMIYTKKGEVLPKESMTYKHLAKSKTKLKSRNEVKSGKIKWFEYSLYRCREKFDSKCKKIIFPYMATDNRFVVDESGLYFCSDVGMIVPKESYCSVEALAALLNSSYFNEVHKQIAKLKRGGYYEYISSGIKQYPLPEIITKSDDKELSLLYKKITESIYALKKSVRTKDQFEKIEANYLKYPNYLNGISKSNLANVNEIILLKLEVDIVVKRILGLSKIKKKAA